MIILVRSNDINPDPRLQKYIDFLTEIGEDFQVLGWNRGVEEVRKPKHEYFNLKAAYGMHYYNIINKLRWFLFIFKYLIKHKKKYHIVHACDFDTALPVYLAKILTKKRMIFDIFDWMSDESKKGVIYWVIGILERKVFEKADYAIICEPERRMQISVVKDGVLVMPNIPTIRLVEISSIAEEISSQKKSYHLILSYVGVFDSDRGLENLLDLLKDNKNIYLNIAGFGHLENNIKLFAKKYDNIKFWGKVDYNQGLNIMKNSDLIIAMYYTASPEHKFAAPNKYYEGLYLGVPIVTTEKTLVGEKVTKYNTGFSIGEVQNSLVNLLEDPNLSNLIKEAAMDAKSLWLNKYENYISNFLENEYLPIVKDYTIY